MIDWTKVGRAETHPVRLAILEAMERIGQPTSPRVLTELCVLDISTVSYHVTQLAKKGILAPAGTKPSRGATEHFYVIHDAYWVEP